MSIFNEISMVRHKYISGMNLTPNIVVLGYDVWGELNKEVQGFFDGVGASYVIGMKVIIDFSCPNTIAVSRSEEV